MVVAREVDVNTKLPSWLAMGWECNPPKKQFFLSTQHPSYMVQFFLKPKMKPKHLPNLCS
jgi:hypothetical protein